MTTNKAYTDLEQSKKLAEILPLESADMDYIPVINIEGEYCINVNIWDNDHVIDEGWIPCWSLAALLSILPTIDDRNAEFCKDIRFDKWHIYYHGTATLPIIDTERYENLVDACYEMILKLNEMKML